MYFFILVVGCSEAEDTFYRALASMDDVKVKLSADWGEAQNLIIDKSPEVVILDGSVVQEKGISAISRVKSLNSFAKVFVLAKCPTVEMAVGSIRAGADEFLTNPPDLVRLRAILKEEVVGWRLRAFGGGFYEKIETEYDFSNIIGESNEIRKVFSLLKKVIPSRNATVLIRGETGTGKGLIARAIHYNTVWDGVSGMETPFVEINCTAIPDNLLESELFGYERGAFTDAKTSKKGLFELADGGTIFLDEIGYMNQNLQIKILKVVEEKNFRKLGGTNDIRVDLRIIAGTNQDLEQAIRHGQFRRDLYYRLNVFKIELPLLRKRGDDIKLLAKYFLNVFNREHRRQIRGFTDGAISRMLEYHWPGNVRELKNVVERAVLMVDGDLITEGNLPIDVDQGGSCAKERATPSDSKVVLELNGIGIPLEMAEKEVVEKVLKLNEGNRSKTARILEISRPRLLRIIKKYSIDA